MVCGARNIFVDLGVNWCNSLELYRRVPEVAQVLLAKAPWLVVGFEASPLITPYAEQCMLALTAEKPIPSPPIIPSGSSRELREYAPGLNCSMADLGLNTSSKYAKRMYARRMQTCVFAALKGQLAALTPEPALSQNRTGLNWRLAQAQTCLGPLDSSRYVLIPAAAGESEGMIRMHGGPEQMLRGGSAPPGRRHMVSASTHTRARETSYLVPQVDLARWLLRSFRVDDFVVLKMDIEGAEHTVVRLNAKLLPKPTRTPLLTHAQPCVIRWSQHTLHGCPCTFVL